MRSQWDAVIDRWHASAVGTSWRASWAFATVLAVGGVMAVLPPYGLGSITWWAVGVGLAVLAAGAVLAAQVPVAHWSSMLAPLSLFPVIAVARAASGTGLSGWTPLMMVPLLWIVLLGTRLGLYLAAAGVALVYVCPAVVVGPPVFGWHEWRPALLWIVVIVVLCPWVQRQVVRLRTTMVREQQLAGRLSSVLQAATEHAVIATDRRGCITLFSEGAERMLGWSSAEVVGEVDPLLLHEPAELLEESRRLRLPVSVDLLVADVPPDGAAARRWTWRRRDGSTLTARVTVTRLCEDGHQVGWTFVGRDVTDEDRAAHRLEVTERRWRTMLDHLPDTAVMIVDDTLTYRVSAGAGLQHLGWDTLDGHTVAETSNPHTAGMLDPVYRAALAGRVADCEVAASRVPATVHVTAVPLPAVDGGAPEALIVARDVTALRRRERDVAAALDFARRLFDEAPHGKLILDREGTVTQINPALCALLGTDPLLLLGRDVAVGAAAGLITHRQTQAVVAGITPRVHAVRDIEMAQGDTLHVELTAVGISGPRPGERLVLISVVDVSERKRFEKQLEHLAHHDTLTGLANRRHFDTELAAHLERCARYGAQGAVIMMDLDNFKEVNDTLGHAAGDQLIISIAAILRRRLRTSDVIARLGGDEFAVLLPVSDRESIETVAASLLDLVRSTVCVLDGSRPRGVTASLGAVLIRDAGVTAGELLATADMTMYDAKDAGRDQYVVYDPTEFARPRSSARIAWATRIEEALDDHRFRVHAQPILDIATHTVRGAELLIRMLDDDGELILPGQFLYVAERSSLITRIDQYMVEQAVTILAVINRTDPHFRISVNLSGRSVGDPTIAALIPTLTAAHDVDPANLVLEITETTAVSDIETARAFADRMRALGCRFALDDFGAGFGSFYYLKHLVFDYVKIDGEFISQIVDNVSDQLVVSSIVQIAHGLGKHVVAEFVKDDAILDLITRLGVDEAQGYHIGRPAPVDVLLNDVCGPPSASPARPRGVLPSRRTSET